MNTISKILLVLLYSSYCFSQTINLNQSDIIDFLRINQLDKNFDSDFSFNIRPIHIGKNGISLDKSDFFDINMPNLNKSLNERGSVKILPLDLNFEYNTHHPYNRNNGSLIPNKGFHNLLSIEVFFELGPISIHFKP